MNQFIITLRRNLLLINLDRLAAMNLLFTDISTFFPNENFVFDCTATSGPNRENSITEFLTKDGSPYTCSHC
jgi:hypothetical protein